MHLPRSDDEEPREIRVIDKRTDPRQVPRVKRLLQEGKHEIQLGLQFDYNENRSLLALLRSAHLLMFRTFGYGYVFDRSGRTIRDVVWSLGHQSPVMKGIVWRFDGAHMAAPTVAIVKRPSELQSFLVILPLQAAESHVAAVTLPGPGSTGEKLYEYIATQARLAKVVAQPLPQATWFIPFVPVWNAVTSDI